MRRALLVATVFALVSSFALVGGTRAQGTEFTLGFQSFAGLIPDVVGQPLENETFDLIGNAAQPTTNGLLVWHRLDNTVAFTDGFQTWVLSPQGLLIRANDQRFDFEIPREQIESQLEALIDPSTPADEVDALVAQAQADLNILEAELFPDSNGGQ